MAERNSVEQTFAFFDDEDVVARKVLERVSASAGPADYELVHNRRHRQAEMAPRIRSRKVAAAAPDLVPLDQIAGADLEPGSVAVAVALPPDGLDQDGVVRSRAHVAQQVRGRIEVRYQDFKLPVVIVIGNSRAATHFAQSQSRAGLESDLGKMTVPQVAEQKVALGIGNAGARGVHLRVDVAVGDEDVLPAVV